MKVFMTIRPLLKITTIYPFDHPRSERIKWVLRSFYLLLPCCGIMAGTFTIISTNRFIDCMESAILAITYTHIVGIFSILLWKCAAILKVIADLQLIYDKGSLLQ